MAKQDDYIKTALRIPKALHARLTAQAEAKGRSLNAEFIASLDGGAAADIPLELKAKLEEAAELSGRSFNAEIAARLQASLDSVDEKGLAFAVAAISAALAEAEVELHTLRLNAGSLASCLRIASKMLNTGEKDQGKISEMTELWLRLADRFDINPNEMRAEGDEKIRAMKEAHEKITMLFDDSGSDESLENRPAEPLGQLRSRRFRFRNNT